MSTKRAAGLQKAKLVKQQVSEALEKTARAGRETPTVIKPSWTESRTDLWNDETRMKTYRHIQTFLPTVLQADSEYFITKWKPEFASEEDKKGHKEYVDSQTVPSISLTIAVLFANLFGVVPPEDEIVADSSVFCETGNGGGEFNANVTELRAYSLSAKPSLVDGYLLCHCGKRATTSKEKSGTNNGREYIRQAQSLCPNGLCHFRFDVCEGAKKAVLNYFARNGHNHFPQVFCPDHPTGRIRITLHESGNLVWKCTAQKIGTRGWCESEHITTDSNDGFDPKNIGALAPYYGRMLGELAKIPIAASAVTLNY